MRSATILLCLLLPLSLLSLLPPAGSASAESEWNQFRGPAGEGKAPAARLPVEFNDTTHVTWKVPITGKAWSSPVIWGKQVWLTNALPDGKKLWALCFDLETGDPIHNLLVFEIENPQFCHEMNSYATPTPWVEAGRVYVHFGAHGTACIDTNTGETLWRRQDLHCDHHRGPASSPIADDRHLYLQFDGFDVQYVVALDKQTGETVWKQDRGFDFKTSNGDAKKAYGTPSLLKINGQQQLVCPAAVATEAFNPENGDLLWTVYHGGMNASSRPLLGAGLVFLVNGMGQMVAVKPGGSGDITRDIAWTNSKSAPKKTTPLLIDDLLFLINDSGVTSCLDAKTGELHWMERIEGDFAASPIYADGKIYCFSRDGKAAVFKAGPKFELLAVNEFPAGFMATPAVSGNALILRSMTHLYRIEEPAPVMP